MNKIDKLLSDAMNAEIKAKEFYQEAASKAQSQAGKKLFGELANFEQNHYERIKKIVQSRKEGVKVERPGSVKKIPQVKPELEGEFEPNKDEIVDIINLAIEAEKNAQTRYMKISDMFDDAEEKAIFSNLAEEERKHQRILEDEFYHMSNKGAIIWE